MDEMYCKKILDEMIYIARDVKHPLSHFLNKSKSNGIDGYNHIISSYGSNVLKRS